MKERPILMSVPLVRSILSGKKTQTRRPIKSRTGFFEVHNKPGKPPHAVVEVDADGSWGDQPKDVRCPYGYDGDQLWVRETFTVLDDKHCMMGLSDRYVYRADCDGDSEEIRLAYISCGYPYQWKPSIFMPRVASRITLDVEEVWVERLHDVSEEDAKAEGVEFVVITDNFKKKWESYRAGFQKKWIEIYGQESYESNPWVWVIKFRRIKL